jgi:DNA-binding transcriptional MerR regulator
VNYAIGEIAKMLRVSTQSLRNWENQGKIPQIQRRPTGIREYTDSDIEAIKRHLKMK